MSIIKPNDLLTRLYKARKQTPKLVQQSLKQSELENINRINLLEGKDNEGNNMPSYRNPEYASYKRRLNPKNRGFWDLKITGKRFHNGLFAQVNQKEVLFKQRFNNKVTRSIFSRKEKSLIVGIREDQFEKVQLDNKPILKKQLLDIINKGK